MNCVVLYVLNFWFICIKQQLFFQVFVTMPACAMSFLLNDHSAKVEGVQSFPHLEAQHGAQTWPFSIYSLDIIFQRRSAASSILRELQTGLYASFVAVLIVSRDNRQSKPKTPFNHHNYCCCTSSSASTSRSPIGHPGESNGC